MAGANPVIHLSDLESIYVGIRLKEIVQKPDADKHVEFPDMNINLDSMTATLLSQPDETYQLVLAEAEDGIKLAPQPENGDSVEFNISPYLQREGIYDLEAGLFSETWAFTRYGNTTSYPTTIEIIDGLKLFFDQYIDEQMQ